MVSKKFQFQHPDDAIAALAQRLATVGVEPSVTDLTGRTLARDVVADRDSPAADVSAMDGYAIRMGDLQRDDPIPVIGESAPGAPPPLLQPHCAVRIFTGAIVPEGSDVVIKREDTEERVDSIGLSDVARRTEKGEHIRRRGENAQQGQTVMRHGTQVTAATCAAMANFGVYSADVFARVGVSIITSGNEVGLFDDQPPEAWQLRNSNRFAIASLLSRPWIRIDEATHCRDEPQLLTETLEERLRESDAVILTGGVSMGDYDYVPDVIRSVGGEVVFHGLPIRPGKPILGAATKEGKLILGLPGNPVSATVGCHRFGLSLLAKMNGQTDWLPHCPRVRLVGGGDKTIPLHWLRLVSLTSEGTAAVVTSQGSGDLVSLGHSSGYVELPPQQSGEGPWPYRCWS